MSSLVLYGIPNCSTVKKARDWLTTHQIPYTFHDFKKQGLNDELAQHWLTQQPWDKLVNRAGMTWRNLPDDEKAAITNNASALPLMLEKTSVIKRPILTKDGKILSLGFVEANYQSLFSSTH